MAFEVVVGRLGWDGWGKGNKTFTFCFVCPNFVWTPLAIVVGPGLSSGT